MRIWPRNLLGQVMLVLALGLLAGQAISGVLLYRAAEQRRDASTVNQIVLRLVSAEERAAERRAIREAMREDRAIAERRIIRNGRRGVRRSTISPIHAGEERIARFEDSLRAALNEQGIAAQSIVVAERLAGKDAFIAARPRWQARMGPGDWRERRMLIVGVERTDGAGWDVVRQPIPDAPRGAIRSIIVQTLIIFAVLFTLLFLVVRRITSPLAQLTERVSSFSRNPDKAVALEERGPQDMRRLISAHNAMESRIAAMLDEKDVMLGAIGHDLKTPLAALRVRIESVPDEVQRQRMAEGIEDITRTLDDILELARVGRSSEAMERTDLAALTASVVEEYEDMGEAVSLEEAPRIAVSIRPILIRRALRNLIDNALRYGGEAKVSLQQVAQDGGKISILVEDNGPGIPPDKIAAMLEPFQRGESSRNRSTGGAGLGLTLARAIAEQHGGKLVLENREEGGLRAAIYLPT